MTIPGWINPPPTMLYEYLEDVRRGKQDGNIGSLFRLVELIHEDAQWHVDSLGSHSIKDAFRIKSRFPVRKEYYKMPFHKWRKMVEERCPGSDFGFYIEGKFYSLKEPKLHKWHRKLKGFFSK